MVELQKRCDWKTMHAFTNEIGELILIVLNVEEYRKKFQERLRLREYYHNTDIQEIVKQRMEKV